MSGLKIRLLAALLIALTFGTVARAAGDSELVGAASSEHLWLVLEPRGKAMNFELVHHARDQAAWQFRTLHTMTQAPAALAARNDAVWLVMPPRLVGGRFQREVFTASVQKNSATGLYYTTPAGRLQMAPALEGLGRLAGIAATAEGLIALLIPAPSSAVSIARANDDDTPRPGLSKPVLARLGPGQSAWTELALPPAFAGARESLLVVTGRQIGLLEPVLENPARSTLHLLQDDNRWSATSFPLDIRTVRAVTQVAGQAVAVLDGRTADRVELAYVRPSGLLPFAAVVAPTGSWQVCGFGDQLLMIERAAGDQDPVLDIRIIDPLSGAVREPLQMTRQPLTAGRMWQVTLALGLALTIVLAVVLLSPRRGEGAMVDPSQVLPLGRRLAALAIDLAIGAVPAMLIAECTPAELLAAPGVTFDPAKCVPYLLMVAIASAVALPLELLTRRSIGKALTGGRITALDGSRPPAWPILLRGVLRLLVLAIPPLAVFALGHSHLQGLPDLAARTLVLRREGQGMPEGSDV